MKSFKIYTENKNGGWIKDLLNVVFDGFTIFHTQGFWSGEEEKALCIEILTDNETLIRAICQRIKHHNNQETVLYTETLIITHFE